MGTAGEDADPADVRARRLETDADAVQLLTIHGVKGLEFPVVLCPFLWIPPWGSRDAVPVFDDPATEQRLVDVGGEGNWDGFTNHAALAASEEDAEQFRAVYVALTRARHHLVVWWGPGYRSEGAPFSKMLFGRERPGDPVGPDTTLLPVSNDAMSRKLRPILDASGGTIATEELGLDRPLAVWEPPAEERRELRAAVFDRAIDRTWRRTSFTGLTGEAAARATVVDVEIATKDDEPAADEEEVTGGVDLPLGGIRGGLHFGNLVHGALEHVDFTDPDLYEDLLAGVEQERVRRGLEVDPTEVAQGLLAAVETPLGTQFGEVRLRDLAAGDTIRELGFELPVRPEADAVETSDLAAVLGEHLPPGHPLGAYPDRLDAMGASRFHGFLSGAIDLVARLPDPVGGVRYWVADYKSNRLGARDRPTTIGDYGPAELAAEMVADDYVLQALLYRVALHRYLRWRLRGYDPERDLGGALYFFVRGMIGPETPVVDGSRSGVFVWEPDAALIEAVSRLFAGRGAP
jgi:exodeoxyribonuclease V beta subunit